MQQKRLVHGQTVVLSDAELADLGTEAADAIKLYGPEQQFIGVASLEARRVVGTTFTEYQHVANTSFIIVLVSSIQSA